MLACLERLKTHEQNGTLLHTAPENTALLKPILYTSLHTQEEQVAKLKNRPKF